MRIAFVSLMAGSSWGGSENLWSRSALLALEQGHEVLISVSRWPVPNPILLKMQNKGATLLFRDRYVEHGSLAFRMIRFFRNRVNRAQKSYHQIIKWKPDHVVISQGATFDISIHHQQLYNMLRKSGVEFSLICHSHSQYGDIPQNNIYPRARQIFQDARFVFFVSQRMKSLTERRLSTAMKNAFITWNPLNIDHAVILPWPSGDTIQFAIVGALEGQKGHDTLFECLSSNSWKNRNWQLNIYGDGYGKKYLEDLVQYFNLAERIIFHGFVSDIKSIWMKNHILLIPSAGEGLPLSLIEAMICGRPAVVTDVGGHAEVIFEERTGFISEAPSVASYGRALEKAFNQQQKWQKMGEQAQKLIRETMHPEPHASMLDKITTV